MTIRTFPVTILVALLAGLINPGCAEVRKLTYPQDIIYLDQEMVTGTMHAMAQSVFRLDELMGLAEKSTATDLRDLQSAIVKELDTLQIATDRLNAGGAGRDRESTTNHPLIDQNIASLIETIAKAQLHAQSDPPNYFWAGKVTGGCSACHAQRNSGS